MPRREPPDRSEVRYDLLDNVGRTSPRTLTPGVDVLAVGQRVMTIFELAGFAANQDLTLRMRSPAGRTLFGDFVISYVVRDHGPDRTRLVVKMLLGNQPGCGTRHDDGCWRGAICS